MAEAERRIRAVVTGRVQNVGFRVFALRRATNIGLSGWVRNLDDSNAVELEAEGSPDAIDEFVRDIGLGPRGALVTGVSITVIPPENCPGAGFQVR